MKKLLLVLLASVSVAFGQSQPSSSAYFGPYTQNALPKVVQYINGYPVYGDSKLTDDGNNLLYNGNPTTPRTSLFTFGGHGDSYVLGAGSAGPAQAQPYTGSAFSQLARTIPGVPAINNGASGITSDSINFNVWSQTQLSPQLPSAYIIDGGANDGTCGTSTGCITNFQEEVSSSIGYLTIPNQERVMGSACTQTVGSWIADTGVYPALTTNYYLSPGNAVSTTSSGSILTCTLTSRSLSKQVGMNFLVTNAQTGTFTVTVDGIAQIDKCSGTTTFTSSPCVANLMTLATTMFRQEFTGISAFTHTLVITTTNTAKVSFTAMDTVTTTPQPNSNYVIAFGPQAHFTNNTLYNAAISAVANQFLADGARVVFADLQSTTNPGPGVNNTTDVSMTPTANCDASLASSHPNDICGYLHLAQTIVNATHVMGWNIFGNPNQFNSAGNLPIVVGNSLVPSVQVNVDSATIPGLVIGTGAGAFNFWSISNARTVGGFSNVRNNAFFGGPGGRGIDFLAGTATGMANPAGGFTQEALPWTAVGTSLTANTTIAPTGFGVFNVTVSTNPISTITATPTCAIYHGITQACELKLIPKVVFTTVTGGNIAVATTAVLNRLLILLYNPADSLWYPSY